MSNEKHRVCPVAHAGSLDNRFRRWLQDPRKILQPYLREGMTVLDLGCGPGFFALDMARMVGASGRVIASDVQEGMLQRLGCKIQGSAFEDRVVLHRCEANKIGLSVKVDFVLAFYMVHELPDQDGFFHEMRSILKSEGQLLIVEPPLHVSRAAFDATIRRARQAGLQPVERPRVLLSKAVLLKPKRTGVAAVNVPTGIEG